MARKKTEYIVQHWNDQIAMFEDVTVVPEELENTADALKAIKAEGTDGHYRIIAVKAKVTLAVQSKRVVTITPTTERGEAGKAAVEEGGER